MADDEEVGNVAQPSEVQDDEILGLLVLCGLDALDQLWSQRVASCAYNR
jgi:hypothetical protein